MINVRVLTVVLVAQTLVLNAEVAERSIRFARGAVETKVAGHIAGAEKVCYSLVARSGQKMKLDADAKNGAITINVTAPDGNTQGEPGGTLAVDLSRTGKYRVCLTESRMGEPWSGSFTLDVKIK